MKSHTINCYLCGSSDKEDLFTVRDNRLGTLDDTILNLMRCRQCRFVFLDPQPDESELAGFYPADYYRPTPTLLERLYGPVMEAGFRQIIADIRVHQPDGRALDVGCGRGYLVWKLLEAGYDAFGIDIADNLDAIVYPQVASRITNSLLPDADFPADSFDLITMKQVLEHVPDPNSHLQQVRRLLKPNGVLYLEVPNFYGLESRLFGQDWYNLEAPRHLFQFSLRTLRLILQKNGFSIVATLGNTGALHIKSPFAFYYSLKYRLNRIRPGWYARAGSLLSFAPVITATPLLRALDTAPGMDIRLIARRSCDA